MKDLYVNEPLLYVDQPQISKPKSNMQTEFVSFQENLDVKCKKNKDKNIQISSFKQLSIEEKIEYLVQFPKDLFQMKCIIVTKDKTYRGTIVRRHDGMIEISYSGRQIATVGIDSIKKIELLGL